MKKLAHVIESLGEVLYHIVSLVSRILNTVFFRGDMYQTLSARTYAESASNPNWEKLRKFINFIFFFQKNHCQTAWQAEVGRAVKTIQRNNAISEAKSQMKKDIK